MFLNRAKTTLHFRALKTSTIINRTFHFVHNENLVSMIATNQNAAKIFSFSIGRFCLTP